MMIDIKEIKSNYPEILSLDQVRSILRISKRKAAWLLQNGFAITGESITYEDKYYQTIAARYCGRSEEYSPVELLVGKHNLCQRPPLFEGLVRHEIHVLKAIVKGKMQSRSADVSEEKQMIARLEELL